MWTSSKKTAKIFVRVLQNMTSWKLILCLSILSHVCASVQKSPANVKNQATGVSNAASKPAAVANPQAGKTAAKPAVAANAHAGAQAAKPAPKPNAHPAVVQPQPVKVVYAGTPVSVVPIPGLVQPAGGQAVAVRIMEIRPGLRIIPGSEVIQYPATEHSRSHAFFDFLLIVMCVAAVVGLVYLHKSRPAAPVQTTTKLSSSSYELLPTGSYGSFKNEVAYL